LSIVSTESKAFDPRQVIDELIGFVRDKATNAGARFVAPSPTEQQIEIAILSAIATEPKNVTEIVKAISLASGGTWKPTSGQVQTAVAKLVDAELAASKNKSDRKIYSITKTGIESLAAATKSAETEDANKADASTKTSSNPNWLSCDPTFIKAATKIGPALLDIAQTGTREQQSRAAAILDQARHDLHVILAEK
jgi:DNA-binding PadR family transcriptional regulator